jgi:hypothetical protein
MDTLNVCFVDGNGKESEPVSFTAEEMEKYLTEFGGMGVDKTYRELQTEVRDNLSNYLTQLNDTNELYKKIKIDGKEYENVDGYTNEELKSKNMCYYENGFNMTKEKDIIKVKTYTIDNSIIQINSIFHIKLNGKITYFMINYFRGGRVKRKNSAVNKEDYGYVVEYLEAVNLSDLLEKQKQ